MRLRSSPRAERTRNPGEPIRGRTRVRPLFVSGLRKHNSCRAGPPLDGRILRRLLEEAGCLPRVGRSHRRRGRSLARPIGVVRGAPAYVNVIATILEVCPDFTVTMAEHAATGDFTFIRWVATGTAPEGRFEFSGVDRVQTRNGRVCENRIYCDDPLFARIATIASGGERSRG